MIIMGFCYFVDHYFEAQIPRFKWPDSKKNAKHNTCFGSHAKKASKSNQIKPTQKSWPCRKVRINVDKTRKLIKCQKIYCANFISREELWNQTRMLRPSERVGWLLCPKIATVQIIIKMWRFWSTSPANNAKPCKSLYVCVAYGHITKQQTAEQQIYAHT